MNLNKAFSADSLDIDIATLTKTLSTERQLKSSIIDKLPNHYIFWKDTNSVFLGCNEAFALSAGKKSPIDVVGKTDYDMPWSKAESDRYVADDLQVMQSNCSKLNIEETQTLPDGKKIILSTSKIPLLDDTGKVCGVLAIYSDITQQKINEQKLIETNQKLEKSYQVKSEFIRNISHDIRTPLAGIQQTVRAISENKIPEQEVREYALAAWEASVNLMQLFDQIIDVSKSEHFDFEDQKITFDLHELFTQLTETYTVVAKNKKLQFKISHPKSLPQLLIGKHLRLHRVLMNLLGNALKFTELGSVTLTAETTQETEKSVTLKFSVIDTGIGIPVEKQKFIFEPFSRLTPSFQGQYPGSGLGLHVVKDYVEKMNGTIFVNSTPGTGSIFSCVLTFEKVIINETHPTCKTADENTIDSTTKTSTAINPLKVLLVEDDRLARSMGALILKDRGYQFDTASSGEEAVKYAETTSYDLIYMDIGLPNIDGLEATRRIRTHSNGLNAKTMIVALTAHADQGINQQCIHAGMTDILMKPLTPEKTTKIETVLNTRHCAKSLDFDLWKTRLGKNAFMMDELFHMLANDFESTRSAMTHAFKMKNYTALASVTHRLKGSLQYCGLPRLEAASSALEMAAKNLDTSEIAHWYTETLDALNEAMNEYEAWCPVTQ